MIAFFIGLLILVLGYLFYSPIAEKIFSPDPGRETPAKKYYDGVDYVPLSTPKNALIQLLNIAGTGPIFGPILGALFGPVAFIIIPIGNVIAGAVHDFFISMISIRNRGAHIPQLAGHFLGLPMKHIVNLFTALLLLLLGTVFIKSPAMLFVAVFHGGNQWYWIAGIFAYYILATLLPIDKIIGKIYPFLGALLLVSAVGIFGGLLIKYPDQFPSFTWSNLHPSNQPLFPMFFMTVTCGLVSGFHSTQSPIIARTLQNERQGRSVFYGMMVVEGFISMVWAAAGMIVFHKTGIYDVNLLGSPSGVVENISTDLFGKYLGVVMVLGVIVLPITSGDTAFRSLRMIIADYVGLKQQAVKNRYIIAIPIFLVAAYLLTIRFDVLWNYFSWANQTTGTIALFISTAYLYIKKKNYWITFLPAIFMLAATAAYLGNGNGKIGFGLSWHNAYIFSAIVTVVLVGLFLWRSNKAKRQNLLTDDVFDTHHH